MKGNNSTCQPSPLTLPPRPVLTHHPILSQTLLIKGNNSTYQPSPLTLPPRPVLTHHPILWSREITYLPAKSTNSSSEACFNTSSHSVSKLPWHHPILSQAPLIKGNNATYQPSPLTLPQRPVLTHHPILSQAPLIKGNNSTYQPSPLTLPPRPVVTHHPILSQNPLIKGNNSTFQQSPLTHFRGLF